MTQRSATIPLQDAISRCEPEDCTIKTRCARWRAHISERTPVADLSKGDISGGTALCARLIHIGTLRQGAVTERAS